MTDDVDRCRTPACRTTPTPGYAPRGLCPFHEAEGLDAIESLPSDWSDLQPLVWDKLRAGLSEAGGGKFGPSEPINYAADALGREIAYTAVQWEAVVRERVRLSEVPEVAQPTYDDLARAARTLAAHYSALVATPDTDLLDYDGNPTTADGIDAIISLAALHRRARSMVGLTTKTTAEPGTCPNCGHETLRHRDGADDVHCATCRQSMTWNDYQDTISVVPLDRAA